MKKICCICGKQFTEFGNNPDPIIRNSKDKEALLCCDQCNSELVIPIRCAIAEALTKAKSSS